MCNKGFDCLKESPLPSDTATDSDGAGLEMDGSSVNSDASPNYNDENPRVKFLCSFSGSILPRPQDGKLRYVGGETRIVSVPRDISYDDLLARMRELYEGAAILKYQQPDEDLDALVSVVNDDDVTNMMEEYDKLGSGDGFTRLRIFLFSHPDQDLSPHYMDGDDRINERRYVDALNSLNESPDYRTQQYNDSPVMSPLDEFHGIDQFNLLNLEGGLHNQRNFEIPIPQYNLRHLAIPNLASGQHSVAVAQRYNDETSWSPGYYSPRYAGPNDPQAISEVPTSPSPAQYLSPFAEVPDRDIDRAHEEYSRPLVNNQPSYDLQVQYSDKHAWLPSDKGGFPVNRLQGPSGFEGNSVCESCKMVFQRNKSATDFKWKQEEQPHMEQSSMTNGLPNIGSSCLKCLPNREVLSQQGGISEQSDPRLYYGETQTSERGWGLQRQLNPHADEPRAHVSGAGRVNDHYIVDGSGGNFPSGHANLSDGHHVPLSYIHHDDPRYIRTGHELGNDLFHVQAVAAGSHTHIPFEERGARHANLSYLYGADNSYQQSHAHLPSYISWRNVPTPMHIHSACDPSHGINVPGFPRTAVEDSPRFSTGVDQNPWIESTQRRMEIDGIAPPDYVYSHAPNQHHGVLSRETQNVVSEDCNQNQSQISNTDSLESLLESIRMPDTSSIVASRNTVSSAIIGNDSGPRVATGGNGVPSLNGRALHWYHSTSWGQLERSGLESVHDQQGNGAGNYESVVVSTKLPNPNRTGAAEEWMGTANLDEDGHIALADDTDLSFLPELVASAKQAKLESVEVVKAIALQDACTVTDSLRNNSNAGERDPANAHGALDCGSDNEIPSTSKIEPTKAEEEAVARGLQTIGNEDLEEIRELGTGTYGAVYHGKWKGSDVAIKRIKASCFAGRPSERERLIADFWKEALILSSLHHPNVVSFYGVVRDGPDGSLATVTEFMVNGSLKQYLKKKDRTIDRRKRLILAMDAAFGMEYLHGKNIVHFDLKCENLLVNMRDPHRPVCKIGDLGLSKVKRHTLVSGGVRGTLPWMAPELLSGKSNMVTEKIDVYSFGIVMWELLTGDEPYADMHFASIIGGIVNNTLRPQIPTWCDPEWKSLMESCWSSDVAQRPSFSEISQRLRNMATAMNLK
ncbi:hypothetical protein Dimus_002435 [Dionaea muscipula]